MKKTKLPKRSFRPYLLHEKSEGQTASDQWFSHVNEQRSSTIDTEAGSSKVDSHAWRRPEFPMLQQEVTSDQSFDCLTKSIEIEEALSTTTYPLGDVRCHVEQNQLILSGRVLRYYYVQLALRMAQRHCGGRKIVNQIEVLPVCID